MKTRNHLSLHDGKEVFPSIQWSAVHLPNSYSENAFKKIQGVFPRRLCSHWAFRAGKNYSIKSNGTELEQVVQSHTSNIVLERLVERVWCVKSQSSLLNIYFCISRFQSSKPEFIQIFFSSLENFVFSRKGGSPLDANVNKFQPRYYIFWLFKAHRQLIIAV